MLQHVSHHARCVPAVCRQGRPAAQAHHHRHLQFVGRAVQERLGADQHPGYFAGPPDRQQDSLSVHHGGRCTRAESRRVKGQAVSAAADCSAGQPNDATEPQQDVCPPEKDSQPSQKLPDDQQLACNGQIQARRHVAGNDRPGGTDSDG